MTFLSNILGATSPARTLISILGCSFTFIKKILTKVTLQFYRAVIIFNKRGMRGKFSNIASIIRRFFKKTDLPTDILVH